MPLLLQDDAVRAHPIEEVGAIGAVELHGLLEEEAGATVEVPATIQVTMHTAVHLKTHTTVVRQVTVQVPLTVLRITQARMVLLHLLEIHTMEVHHLQAHPTIIQVRGIS